MLENYRRVLVCLENFYSKSLNAVKLYDVYRTKIGRVKQYLEKEIEFVLKRLSADDALLEIGAGYGRIMKELCKSVKFVHGIDISDNSVAFGLRYLEGCANCELKTADVYSYTSDVEYDTVLCLQNGISAIGGNTEELVKIALKTLKRNGTAYFSSYSPKFWDTRLAWFEEQSGKGLLAEIDYNKTGDGKIICKDGFTSSAFSERDMERLGRASGCSYEIQETDNSSLFLIIRK